ncbi:MAG: winged helix-turn-helix domain-containing protein [Alloprevotella sp.]|uniref:winged helix-turn-helix domain-containing protein n=1 Tax=Prevotellamassilia timonensis TaxID=1852370 RepID=UPI001DE8C08A|nr:winged helix-turn-helix domain-containing protein [Prevotellamassilia timonensis]MBS7396507.1 winged helix-turn-helix domain-containing protein [Prevotellamassilia sp.]MCI5507599.1 winged helix-turn-helix domain-containing protein [Bacteroidales bacterium]MDY2974605.1 winged helix-turn-helix domain-containing protein [Alloprevotella sp.]MCF2634020.1 winged helix-turn-helix domain-containing protein [Prevotellamassilia timonensis]MCI6069686.1 winged helix-turn-helix domain-containing protein
MFEEKTGAFAGKIWEALNEGGKLTGKELKKAAKLRTDKELYLGLGWLLREGKLVIEEVEKDIEVALA